MAEVIDTFTALATTPRGTFPLVRSPQAIVPDFPWAARPTKLRASTNLSIDTEAQCIHPAVFRIPTNNFLEAAESACFDDELAVATAEGGIDAAYETLTWTVTTASAGYDFWPIWGADTNADIAIYAFAAEFADTDAGEVVLDTTLDCQAFKVLLDFEGQPSKSIASGAMGGTSSTPTVPPQLSFHFAIGTGDVRKWYRVLVNGGGMFLVQTRLDSVATWKAVQSSARPNLTGVGVFASFYKAPSKEPIEAEVRLMGGKLTIRLGTVAVNIDEARKDGAGEPIWKISALKVEAKKALSLLVRAQQLYFHNVMTYESQEVTTGFISSLCTGIDVKYAIDDAGWSADLDTPLATMLGPDVLYEVTFTGPVDGTFRGNSWSQFAPAIRAINLQWDGAEDYLPEAPVELGPASWIAEHFFDPSSLSINSGAEIAFNSNKPQLLPSGATGTWGQWIVDTGQFALALEGARTLPDGTWPGNERLFTGYGNTSAMIEGTAGNVGAKLRAMDRSRQLMSPRPYLPWMDAWNSFYAIFFLAQMRGVSPDDMAFLSSVPVEPLGASVDEDGQPSWHLPVGPANSMLVRPSLGAPVWHIMLRIARSAGYMLYFDLFGKLQYRKFRLPSGAPKRSFFESDPESYAQLGGGLEGCWNVSVQKSMDQVRSQLVLMGPSTFEGKSSGLVTVAGDTGVVDDGNAYNHLGYENESIWIDTQFSIADYAADACESVFATQKVPFLGVTITTWFQPDIYPLDLISLESPKLGTSGIPLMVLSVRHCSPPGGPASSTIAGMHYVPTE